LNSLVQAQPLELRLVEAHLQGFQLEGFRHAVCLALSNWLV
jgi:hypothetical protein